MASLDLVTIDMPKKGGRETLQGFSCRFDTREFTVIAGSTGSGKSCLAGVLNGSLAIKSGEFQLDGRPIRRASAASRAMVASVPQNPSTNFVAKSVQEEIRFGLDRRMDIAPLLQWAQLEQLADADPRELSFGEQRRLAIATALAAGTPFLVLDDPFQGLDHAFIPRLIERLIQHHQAGHGIVLMSNELEKILAHADRLILLKQGRIIADALPERVLPYLDAHGFRKPTMKLAEMSWLRF